MPFNSLEFAVFLPIVFAVYWLIAKNLKAQNILLLAASYFFYAWWDWRLVFVLLICTLSGYLIGNFIHEQTLVRRKKLLLAAGLIINLGSLIVFKYFNFFISNFNTAFTLFGQSLNWYTLDILLPVGLSFYTLQISGYLIDIYRSRIEPAKDAVSFFAFISFFPKLATGPIERASHFLPQFYIPRIFDYARSTDGLRQILWGLFKKIVIADSCAYYVNLIFNNPGQFSGSTLALGAVLFTIQIYGDFSGYSDIALGVARLFGFELMPNFAYPYFSRDIAEFWRRWHISLTTWLKEYVYFPLGGNRGSKTMKLRNTFIVFIVSGLWHGAGWTYISWGGLNALYFLPMILFGKKGHHLETVAQGKLLPSPRELGCMVLTFLMTVFAWIFFRAESVKGAVQYIGGIFSSSLFSLPQFLSFRLGILVILFFGIEWLYREQPYAIARLGFKWPSLLRWLFYFVLLFLVLYYSGSEQPFIYSNF